jgi:hypothetical protein
MQLKMQYTAQGKSGSIIDGKGGTFMFWEILLPALFVWLGIFVIAEIRGSREEAEYKKQRDADRAAARRSARV